METTAYMLCGTVTGLFSFYHFGRAKVRLTLSNGRTEDVWLRWQKLMIIRAFYRGAKIALFKDGDNRFLKKL